MIFKQLFDKNSSTYTYLIADLEAGQALFIDPVNTNVEEYLELLSEMNLTLLYSFETHVHADHVSGSGLLRQKTGAKTGIGLHCGSEVADFQLEGDESFVLGSKTIIRTIHTPGHTPGSMSFLCRDKVFTGDALFIGGCGRTDFQNGDPGQLYDSVTEKLFTLPNETVVYPAHDYKGDFVSCIQQEKTKNPRFVNKTREEFIELMNNLNLPMPKLIDKAVPANLYCGIDEEEALQMANSDGFTSPENERRGVQGIINQAKKEVKTLDVKAAENLIREKSPIIIDVREPHEYNSGHLENAINIPRGDITEKIDTILSDENKNSQVLIYCASGNRSALAASAIKNKGFTNVISMTGGYIQWKREVN